MIIPILFVIFGGSYLVFVILTIVTDIKEINLQKAILKEQEEKLNSVIPGTILCKKNRSENPFDDEYNLNIKVLEVKRNSEGEIWIKYAYEDILHPGMYYDESPSYGKLKDQLRIYPEIKIQTL